MTNKNNTPDTQLTGTNLVERPQNQIEITPTHLIQLAVEKNADPEQLGKLMELQIRWEDRNAQKEYVKALAKFRSLCPPITKSKSVGYKGKSGGNVGYNYAPLDKALDVIKPIEMECELNHTWIQEPSEKNVKVTCKLTHIAGHSETTSLSAPPDISGSKNPVQAIGSTVFYLERYTLLALLGIAPVDIDDDGGEKQEAKSKNMLIDTVITEVYKEYCEKNKSLLAKNTNINKELFIQAVRDIYSAMEPEHKENFTWDKKNIEILVSQININKTLKKNDTK